MGNQIIHKSHSEKSLSVKIDDVWYQIEIDLVSFQIAITNRQCFSIYIPRRYTQDQLPRFRSFVYTNEMTSFKQGSRSLGRSLFKILPRQDCVYQ